MRVYIATSFANWPEAKRVTRLLADVGISCSSSWIRVAEARLGADAAGVDLAFAKDCHRQNYADIDASDAMLVLRVPHMGEGFFEAYHALYVTPMIVSWVGTPILSATVSGRVDFHATAEDAVKDLAYTRTRLRK